MRTRLTCLECSLHGFIDLMQTFNVAEEVQQTEIRAYLEYLSQLDYSIPPPAIARHSHQQLKRILQNNDPYLDLKKKHNQSMLEKYALFYDLVKNHPDPVLAALKLSISGNVIDLGMKHQMNIEETVHKAIETEIKVNHIDRLLNDLKENRSILYLLDNTGEIVLDKLFIQIMLEHQLFDPDKITAVVRGMPIINDATMADAVDVGLPELVPVISNGDGSPGTLLEHTSLAFIELFQQADLIISKGQGNFETLNHHRDKNIYFLLLTKCPIVARELNLSQGDFICKHITD
ncbi:MAG: damage-control phosphatase ARMT1 family protein [Candidatus Cyclobacteriaceae bacterium M3_2C_046]